LTPCTCPQQRERAAGFAGAVEASSKPSDEIIARTRRRTPNVEAALQHLTGKTFPSQSAADSAFEGASTKAEKLGAIGRNKPPRTARGAEDAQSELTDA
jgi:hypothetical protein